MPKINNSSVYGEVRSKPLKPDKLALKNKLYSDREELSKKLIDTHDLIEKRYIRIAYDLVNSYIEICLKRNKF